MKSIWDNGWKRITLIAVPTFLGLFLIISFLIFSNDTNTKPLAQNESLENSQGQSQTNERPDTDGDGLKDWEEKLRGTDPFKADTDGDGTADGVEVKQNRDPLKSAPGDNLNPETGQTPKEVPEKTQINQTQEPNEPSEPAFTNTKPEESTDLSDNLNNLKTYGNTLGEKIQQIGEIDQDVQRVLSFWTSNEEKAGDHQMVLKKASGIYSQVAVELQTGTTPNELVSQNSAIVLALTNISNNYQKLASSVESLDGDFYENHTDDMTDLRNSYYKLAEIFESKSVVFKANESGNFFTQIAEAL